MTLSSGGILDATTPNMIPHIRTLEANPPRRGPRAPTDGVLLSLLPLTPAFPVHIMDRDVLTGHFEVAAAPPPLRSRASSIGLHTSSEDPTSSLFETNPHLPILWRPARLSEKDFQVQQCHYLVSCVHQNAAMGWDLMAD